MRKARKKIKRVRKSTSTIRVEDEIKPENLLHQSLIFIYGAPKIGKSEFFSHFTDPYYVATEPGLGWLGVRRKRVDDWEEFTELMIELKKRVKNGKFTAGYIVVDTVDNLFRFCLEHVCKSRKIDHPSDEGYGKGWEALGREWAKGIARLVTLMPGVGVGFIGHSTEREVEHRNMKITKTVPEIQKRGFRTINALCDFVLHAGAEEVKTKTRKGKSKYRQKRFLYTRPTENVETGARGPHFPSKISFDFETFASYF